jgi:hypothetical protein
MFDGEIVGKEMCCTCEQEQTLLAKKDYCIMNLGSSNEEVQGYVSGIDDIDDQQSCSDGDQTYLFAKIDTAYHKADKPSTESLPLFHSPRGRQFGSLLTEMQDVHQLTTLKCDCDNYGWQEHLVPQEDILAEVGSSIDNLGIV